MPCRLMRSVETEVRGRSRDRGVFRLTTGNDHFRFIRCGVVCMMPCVFNLVSASGAGGTVFSREHFLSVLCWCLSRLLIMSHLLSSFSSALTVSEPLPPVFFSCIPFPSSHRHNCALQPICTSIYLLASQSNLLQSVCHVMVMVMSSFREYVVAFIMSSLLPAFMRFTWIKLY